MSLKVGNYTIQEEIGRESYNLDRPGSSCQEGSQHRASNVTDMSDFRALMVTVSRTSVDGSTEALISLNSTSSWS